MSQRPSTASGVLFASAGFHGIQASLFWQIRTTFYSFIYIYRTRQMATATGNSDSVQIFLVLVMNHVTESSKK